MKPSTSARFVFFGFVVVLGANISYNQILIAAQCALLFIETCSCHPHGYRIGLFITISSGFLGLDIVLKWLETGGQSPRLFVIEPNSITIVVQILIALSLCLNCLDLPRRPAVYFDDELVDEQSYISILNK